MNSITRTPRTATSLLTAAVLAAALTACGSVPGTGGTAVVVYEVSGPTQANNITYGANGSAGVAQENEVTLPWRKEVTMEKGLGAVAVPQVTAQNAGDGTITCRISVDGEVVTEVTSQGQYAIASCASEALI
ncbi:MAG: MmpS family transport accessory protein [Egibacteraceae bacterium]